MMDLPDQWTVNANVKELLHQLSSILYRCKDGANFSKRNRNNLSFDELYKLFDWDVYRCAQVNYCRGKYFMHMGTLLVTVDVLAPNLIG